MEYKTILVNKKQSSVIVTFNRPEQRNSINGMFLTEINAVLDDAEKDPDCSAVIFEGQNGVFNTGMDFNEMVDSSENNDETSSDRPDKSALFIETIKRFTLSDLVVISNVDGLVVAGGIGIAAASDLVIATPRSQFNLSEALWGLLPAMVVPFLIRRVGFQKAYSMTLTTLPVSADEAYDMHLVDKVSDKPSDIIRQILLRVNRINSTTIKNIKDYFRKMWIVDEMSEETAKKEIARLVNDPTVIKNIQNYIKYEKMPWQN